MASSSLLKKIPNHLLVSIFSEWLSITDVAAFDSACCESEDREVFLNAICCRAASFHSSGLPTEPFHSRDFLQWLIARGISVTDLKLRIGPHDKELWHSISAKHFKVFHKLESLSLSCCIQFSDAQLSSMLKHCHNMKSLKIDASANISDQCLASAMKTVPQLTALNISGCCNVSDAFFEQLFISCPRIAELDMSGCYDLRDEALLFVASGGGANITHLNISRVPRVTNLGIAAISNRCSSLRCLNMSNCLYVTDDALICLSRGCKQLSIIDLTGCTKVTDVGICAIAESSSVHLERLNVCACRKITDPSLHSLGAHCPNLKSLQMFNCVKVTDSGVLAVSLGCPALEEIDLMCCENITNSSINGLICCCPSLISLTIAHCAKVSEDAVMHALYTPLKIDGVRCAIRYLDVRGIKICSSSVEKLNLYVNALDDNMTVMHTRKTNECSSGSRSRRNIPPSSASNENAETAVGENNNTAQYNNGNTPPPPPLNIAAAADATEQEADESSSAPPRRSWTAMASELASGVIIAAKSSSSSWLNSNSSRKYKYEKTGGLHYGQRLFDGLVNDKHCRVIC